MLFIKPDAIVFEKHEDILDYVTLGVPPTRRNFDALMEAIHTTYDDVCIDDGSKDGEQDLILKKNIIPDEIDPDVYEEILRTTYHNRIINTVGVSICGILLTVGAYFIGKSDGREEAKHYYGSKNIGRKI